MGIYLKVPNKTTIKQGETMKVTTLLGMTVLMLLSYNINAEVAPASSDALSVARAAADAKEAAETVKAKVAEGWQKAKESYKKLMDWISGYPHAKETTKVEEKTVSK